MMRDLKLTETQQQQVRTIVDRFVESIEPQRQALMEMRKQKHSEGTVSEESRQKARELHEQIEASRNQMHSELLAVLSTEQRAQYDQFEQQWKARRDERRQRRGRGFELPQPEEQ
jgi:Spy/CpxP family protein refolding chaperone